HQEDDGATDKRQRFEQLAENNGRVFGGRCSCSGCRPFHQRLSTFLSSGPYCGEVLMAFAQPISFAFSTYALLVAGSKLIVSMPACFCRAASSWLYFFQKSFWFS